MNTRAGISEEQSKACRIVLLELAELLAPWWSDIVVVGGLAVQLSIKEPSEGMFQTMDVDLALDIRSTRRSEVAEDMHSTLLAALYDEPEPGGKAFRYFRTVTVDGQSIRVPVDFLTGDIYGTDPNRSCEHIEGINISKLSGCELAFQQLQVVKAECSAA